MAWQKKENIEKERKIKGARAISEAGKPHIHTLPVEIKFLSVNFRSVWLCMGFSFRFLPWGLNYQARFVFSVLRHVLIVSNRIYAERLFANDKKMNMAKDRH